MRYRVQPQTVFEGYCPICERRAKFLMKQAGLFRSMRCSNCDSGPRQRALWVALNGSHPNWRALAIHEASPGWDPVTSRLMKECERYTASHYDPRLPFGDYVTTTNLPCGRYINEDLEQQSFADGTFDLVITQDVFEHLFDPLKAISEIARTLKPDGAVLMTVPVVRKFAPSRRRARRVGSAIEFLLPPEYHGNPLSSDGSLVTIDWGFDIAAQLARASSMYFVMQSFENMDYGIRDECNQILIGFKPAIPDLNIYTSTL